ncbi:MAG TPA: alpha/beta hydrolase [Micromonosporaceae bacterium]|nr:alpha/beta hydrolase [Micromonosporaceae bacterium]
MDPSRMHPQARTAMEVQQHAALTVDNVAAMRRSMRDATPDEVGAGPPVHRVMDLDADGVPVRLYVAEAQAGVPVLVYAHGGGWVLGDLETHDGLCRHLAVATGWAVLAVDYRRPPEFPCPAAADDLERALAWVRRTAATHGLDRARIAVAGDSSGAHVAAVVARRARDAGRPVVAQVLICPVIDPAMDYPDLDGYGLRRDEMRFFWDAYAPTGVDRQHPDVNPLRADLAGLPPAVVITAELDVLRDDGERYASRLLAAGVPVTCVRYLGVNHNFVRKLAVFDAASVAVAQIAAALRRY